MSGGGHAGQGSGHGAANHLIDLASDVTVDNEPGGPNLTFTDGSNATLHLAISNSGNEASDQTITVTVGPLPSGLTYVSYASVTAGVWACSVSGQSITCTSSASVSGLVSAMPIFNITVSVAKNASGNAQLPVSTSTPDGQPATNGGAKGVAFSAAAPNITSLNSTQGSVGTAVTISGSGFGPSQGSSTVTFNGTAAGNASSWSSSSITVNVPCGASTGNVVVTAGGAASNGMNFTVSTAPVISSLNPNSGAVGTAVTISGCNFGSAQGSTTVTFNGTPAATAIGWTNTSIKMSVPKGATSGNAVVIVSGTASNGVNFTVTAQSGCNASAGNATALLTGDYVFSGQGQNQAHFYAFAGRFHADGVNTITNGLIEQNQIGLGGDYIAPVTFTGCFNLNTPQGSSGVALGTLSINAASAILGGQNAMTLAIAIQSNGDGRLITHDSNQVQVSGSVQRQCPNAASGSCPAFANANVSGDYAFGFAGMLFGGGGDNFAAVGRFTTDGAGGASNALIDMSSYAGIDASNDSFTASYSLDASNGATDGRVMITANVTYNRTTAGNNGLTVAFEFGCYLANINNAGIASDLYCITTNGTSQGPPEIPLLHGRFTTQSTPSGGWTNANVIPESGASVGSSTGIDGSGNPRTSIFQVNSWNPNANPPTVAFNQDLNKGGSSSFTANAGLDYSVAPNGRIQISNPATSPATLLSVGYILRPGEGFTVDVNNNAALGFLQPQEAMPAGGFTTANFDNAFAFGTAGILESGVTHFDGVATSNGSGGMLSGQGYLNGSVGPAAGNVAATYSIASPADAAIGRVTSSLTAPFVDSAVLYIIDANTAVTMSTMSSNPAIVHLTH